MSVKQSILALLSQGDSYGYQLKADFEATTGGIWPLNIGQVYTTLDRLEKANLVERRGADEEGRVSYRITAAGRQEVAHWFATPVDQSVPQRDELSIKLAIAVTMPGVDVAAIVQTQRRVAMLILQDLNRSLRQAEDVAWRLVLQARIFQTEAEVRWLDHCEGAVLAGNHRRQRLAVATPAESHVSLEARK